MNERIYITTDQKKVLDFFAALDSVEARSNNLIETFEAFQAFRTIDTIEDFTWLITDPAKAFDEVLLANIDLKITGNKKPDMDTLSKLLGIDRSNYMNLVSGIPVVVEDCPECRSKKLRQGKKAITLSEYNSLSAFLTFVSGRFSVDNVKAEEHEKTFSIYAENDAQVALYEQYIKLIAVLNDYVKKFPIPAGDKEVMAKDLHLGLAQAISGDFCINSEYLKNQILKLK